MFVDTHCHLTSVENKGIQIDSLFQELSAKNFQFLLDIGTECNDLQKRKKYIATAQKHTLDLRFSAGIWPSQEASLDRFNQIHELKNQIECAKNEKIPLCAIGECGIDLHWNEPSKEQTELFEMQIELAKTLNLPVIIHSRSGFDETISCLKNMNYHNGVIHCFSYNVAKAVQFLDLGWYISFSGSITYAKKDKAGENEKLITYIPNDLLLLETDAPYLAPKPERGKTNTSLLIAHTYEFIANKRNQSLEDLQKIIYANSMALFGNKAILA
ncbi:MAG: TatD family hydrolase [Treponemataceae bacterium]